MHKITFIQHRILTTLLKKCNLDINRILNTKTNLLYLSIIKCIYFSFYFTFVIIVFLVVILTSSYCLTTM